MFLFFLFVLIIIKFVISDTLKDSTMKVQEFQQMERKAKTFACSLLAESPILSKKKEKQIREYLKKNNFLKSDSESSVHEKIKQFKTSICFNNIYTDRANDILMALSDGKYDLLNDKDNSKFFEFDKNSDFSELTKNMKETNEIMEDLKKEEESLHEKRKDDPELDNSLKDIEKKMFKNPKYDLNGGQLNFNSMDLTTEREEREKREKIKQQKKFNKHGYRDINDLEFNFKNLIEHPEILRKYLGIKSLIGFIIFMIIITIIDNRNQNRIIEEEKKKKEKKEEKKEENQQKEKKEEKKEENQPKEKKDENKNINKDETNKEKKE